MRFFSRLTLTIAILLCCSAVSFALTPQTQTYIDRIDASLSARHETGKSPFVDTLYLDILSRSELFDRASIKKDQRGITRERTIIERTKRLALKWLKDLPEEKAVEITYYADSFAGRWTAAGTSFSQSAFTAAACEISLGSVIRITVGSKQLDVVVNDRPNCSKYPNVVDLSREWFSRLGALSTGRLQGSMRVIGSVSSKSVPELIWKDFFLSLSVSLSQEIPSLVPLGSTLSARGRVTTGEGVAMVYLIRPDGEKVPYITRTDADGQFSVDVPMNMAGSWELIIVGDTSFQTTSVARVIVMDGGALLADMPHQIIRDDLEQITIERREMANMSSLWAIVLPGGQRGRLFITQGGKYFMFEGNGTIALSSETFRSLDASVPASVGLWSENDGVWTRRYHGQIALAPLLVGPSVPARKVSHKWDKYSLTGDASWDAGTPFHAYLIEASGAVKDLWPFITPESRQISVDMGTLKKSGVYRIELVGSDGLAIHDEGFAVGATLAVMPTAFDSRSDLDIGSRDSVTASADSLGAINTLRSTLKLKNLVLDETLSRYAQMKADDMAKNDYVGHTDSQGRSILGLIQSVDDNFSWAVGENVAGGSVSYRRLIKGLELSAGHRSNMLNTRWGGVGIGIAISNWNTYYVQVFGE